MTGIKLKVIRCGKLIDGTTESALKNAIIVIEGAKILDVGIEKKVDVPEGPEVYEIDCSELTVLPGLIDSHVHLALGAGSNYEEMFSHSDAHLKADLLARLLDYGERLERRCTRIAYN